MPSYRPPFDSACRTETAIHGTASAALDRNPEVNTCLDINLWCIIYPKRIDRDLVQLMARAGCREISLGFESGSGRMLGSFNKRFQVEEVRTVSRMFADVGIQRRGFLLLDRKST